MTSSPFFLLGDAAGSCDSLLGNFFGLLGGCDLGAANALRLGVFLYLC